MSPETYRQYLKYRRDAKYPQTAKDAWAAMLMEKVSEVRKLTHPFRELFEKFRFF